MKFIFVFLFELQLLAHGSSLKENLDVNETNDVSTSSMVDGCDTTDISMTESISFDTCSVNEDVQSLNSGASSKEVSPDHHRSLTLPTKFDGKNAERDEIDDLLQVERNIDSNEKLYQTLPSPMSSQSSPDKQSSIQSNVACISSSTQPDEITKSETEDLSKTETDYKSAETTQTSSATTTTTTDDSTLTNKSNDDEYYTPMNTLKPVDFDDFKRQMREEFIQNTSELQHSNDDTLKSRQPIDPRRINDSLKLYSENMMSKSFSGESVLREVPTSIHYQTLNNNKSDSSSNSVNYALKKSGSTAVSSSSDLSTSTENGINRSRSGPNWYRNQYFSNDNDSDDSSATLKPATMNKRSINIKMDCYDEIRNGVSSTTSEASTATTATTTTMTSPTSPYDDDLDDDLNDCVVVLRKPKTGSTAIKRRSGNRRYVDLISFPF